MYGITAQYKILKIVRISNSCIVVVEFTPEINGEVRSEFVKRNKLYTFKPKAMDFFEIISDIALFSFIEKVFTPNNSERFIEVKDKTPYLKYLI